MTTYLEFLDNHARSLEISADYKRSSLVRMEKALETEKRELEKLEANRTDAADLDGLFVGDYIDFLEQKLSRGHEVRKQYESSLDDLRSTLKTVLKELLLVLEDLETDQLYRDRISQEIAGL